MKAFIPLTLASVAFSSPIYPISSKEIETAPKLDTRETGTIAKEFTRGGCRDVIFIFARGSVETGNMVSCPTRMRNRFEGAYSHSSTTSDGADVKAFHQGSTVGPPTSDGLKKKYGDNRVATEGVDYAAALTPNFLPGGADPDGVATMRKLLNDAASKCPNAKLVAGGYR